MVLLGVVVLAGGVLAVVLLTGGDDQSEVEVRRGDPLPEVGELNRADDYGADVVRAFLTASLTCRRDGERVMNELSRPGEVAAREIMRDACTESGGRPLAGMLRAVAQEDLDARGRSLWRVTASNGKLPDDLVLRVRQSTDGWEIDRPCSAICPSS